MLAHYIAMFIHYLNANAHVLAPFFPIYVFFAAMLESTPFIGTIMPGTMFLIFFGFSAYTLHVNLALLVLASLLGALIGDILGYLLGKHGSEFLLSHKKLLKEGHVSEGRRFISNHGAKSILIGRFIGPIRPIISLIAGSVHMKFSKFMFYDLMAAFLWSFIYLTLGFYFGNHFRLLQRIIARISLALFILAIIGIAIYYFKRKKDKKHENKQEI